MPKPPAPLPQRTHGGRGWKRAHPGTLQGPGTPIGAPGGPLRRRGSRWRCQRTSKRPCAGHLAPLVELGGVLHCRRAGKGLPTPQESTGAPPSHLGSCPPCRGAALDRVRRRPQYLVIGGTIGTFGGRPVRGLVALWGDRRANPPKLVPIGRKAYGLGYHVGPGVGSQAWNKEAQEK